MISPYFLPSLRLCIGALAALSLTAPVGAYQEQPQEQGTVGPAEIKDFSLPATRQPQPEPAPIIAPLTPPAAQPQTPIATPTPAPTVTLTPAPPSATPTTRAPSGRSPTPAQTRSDPAPIPPQAQDPQETLPVAPAPTIAPQPLPQSAPVAEPPAAIAPEREPEGGFPWLYLLLGTGGAGLGVLGWRRFAKAGEAPTESFAIAAAPRAPKPEPRPEPQPQPKPAPALAPVTAEPGAIGIVMRPWLEIEFKPDRATATADGAGVQYEIVIRNTGNAPARNVRVAAQMFNAGPQLDKEIAAFFAATVDDRGAAPLTLLPRTEVRIQSQVGMPRAEMREIKVQGRSLFIPTVAFNLLYNWGRDKTGQTCSSHIVGREPETPSQKMAPFRLDLGPRTYRQVGQRPSVLARAV